MNAEAASDCYATGSDRDAQNGIALLNVPARDVTDEEVTLGTLYSMYRRATVRMPGADTSTKCESWAVTLMDRVM